MRGLATALATVILLAVPSGAAAALTYSVNSSGNPQLGETNQPQAIGDGNADVVTYAEEIVGGAQAVRLTANTDIGAVSPCLAGRTTATCRLGPPVNNLVPAVRIKLLGGNDQLSFGADSSAVSSQYTVDAGEGNDTVRGGAIFGNVFGGPGDDDLEVTAPSGGTVSGNQGQDVVRASASASLGGAEGSDIYLVTGASQLVALNVSHGQGLQTEVQVADLDGNCDDGMLADTAPSTGAARQANGVACSNNGVDRDNWGSGPAAGVTMSAGGIFAATFTAGPGPDRVFGSNRSDTLAGGPGADTHDARDGDDILLTRDGTVDALIRCGPGTDRVEADPADRVEPDCERIDRGGQPGPVGGGTPVAPGEGVPDTATAPTAPLQPNVPSSKDAGTGPGGGDDGKTPPEIKFPNPVATLSKTGRAQLRVICVYRAKECAGTVSLKVKRAAKVRSRGRTLRLKAGQKVGAANLSIPWGRSDPVNVPVSPAVRNFLKAKRGPLVLEATVVARDSGAGANAAKATARSEVRIGRR